MSSEGRGADRPPADPRRPGRCGVDLLRGLFPVDQKRLSETRLGGSRLGTFLFIVLGVLLLLVLAGAGGYSVRRRYWSPAGSEVVETSDTGSGVGPGIAAAFIALLLLAVLFFGFTQWNWFGTTTTRSSGPSQTIA